MILIFCKHSIIYVGEIIVKKLTKMVLSYKLYPALMLIMSVFYLLRSLCKTFQFHTFKSLTVLPTTIFIIIVISYFYLLILRATFNMLIQFLGDHLAFKIKHMLREQMILKKSVRSIGEEINILTESIDGIGPFFQSYLPQVFKSMLIPIVIIITMCFVHLPTAIIMIVTAPFIPLFYVIFGLKTRDESKDQMTYLNQFSQRF